MHRRQLLRSVGLLAGFGLAAAGETAVAQTAKTAAPVKDTRLTKAQANYREDVPTTLICAACMYYVTPDICKIMQGSVSPEGTCDLYGQ